MAKCPDPETLKSVVEKFKDRSNFEWGTEEASNYDRLYELINMDTEGCINYINDIKEFDRSRQMRVLRCYVESSNISHNDKIKLAHIVFDKITENNIPNYCHSIISQDELYKLYFDYLHKKGYTGTITISYALQYRLTDWEEKKSYHRLSLFFEYCSKHSNSVKFDMISHIGLETTIVHIFDNYSDIIKELYNNKSINMNKICVQLDNKSYNCQYYWTKMYYKHELSNCVYFKSKSWGLIKYTHDMISEHGKTMNNIEAKLNNIEAKINKLLEKNID